MRTMEIVSFVQPGETGKVLEGIGIMQLRARHMERAYQLYKIMALFVFEVIIWKKVIVNFCAKQEHHLRITRYCLSPLSTYLMDCIRSLCFPPHHSHFFCMSVFPAASKPFKYFLPLLVLP